MLHIILLVLKIIGIVLLCLLGFLLLSVCLVLFVPVRYLIKAERVAEPESNYALARITWLLHIVRVSVFYENEEIKPIIRLFGIKLNLNKEKKEEKEKKQKKTKETKAAEAEDEFEFEFEATETAVTAEAAKEAPFVSQKGETVPQKTLETKEKQSFFLKCKGFFQKLVSFIKNFKKKTAEFFQKLSEAKDNLDYYFAACEDERNQKVIRLCLEQLEKILHNMKPSKFRAVLHIGVEDPAAMGQLLAVLGMIYPFFEGNLSVEPEFLESVFEGSLYIKGRVTAFVLLRAAWKIYFNKDFKRMIHILKKEAV